MIRRPSMPSPRTMPGRYVSTGSSSATLPSPASWSITVAVNILVLLASRTLPVAGTGAPVRRSDTPAVYVRMRPSGRRTEASAPGKPSWLTRRSRLRCTGWAPAAVAGTAEAPATARQQAAAKDVKSGVRVRVMDLSLRGVVSTRRASPWRGP